MPSLLVRDGPLSGRHVPVSSSLVVGRVGTDLDLDDPLVSRRHAVVRLVDGELEIEDLGSLNGTWVNGERLSQARRLRAGDLIAVGTTVIQVAVEPGEGPRTLLAGPEEVARAAREGSGHPVSPAEPARSASDGVEDELRPTTALFADIVGSTRLGERLAPHEVKALVGECITRMSRAVEQFGGTVQAYMGDGIAAFFGVPVAHEDDPERAARAALRILEIVEEYAREVEATWGIPDFSARIGLNTGEVAVGLVGAGDPQSVTLGDTANVAARLQASADPGTVVIGETTARRLLPNFVLEPLGEVTVKGRAQPVAAWRLVFAQAAAGPSEDRALVGRRSEISRLSEVVEDLAAGRGQILFLLGEAGIGKTRLLAELRRLAGEKATWLEGRCLSYGAEVPYGPAIQIVRTWIGAEDSEPELAVRTKLRAQLGLLLGPNLAEHALPYLSRLLGVRTDPEGEARLGRLPPDALADEIRGAYLTWITALARRGPVVIALEDLHWADPATRELAEGLLDVVDLAPLLVIGTLRPERASDGWGLRVRALADYVHRTSELSLGPLADGEARELLAALPHSRTLAEPDLEQIVASAEGNPLYLEELASAFAEGGGPRRDQTIALTATAGRILSPTLESVLLARIDRLTKNARRLVQIAAIVGRGFPLRILEELEVVDGDDLEQALSELLRADVIREQGRFPETVYVFRHGLLREASLSTLPPERRRELYGSVGEAFERLLAGALDEHLELLAHYFARSPKPAKALEYLERAGERAAALDAVASAAEHWRRAIKIAQKLGDHQAQRRLGARLDALRARSGERLRPPVGDDGLEETAS